MHFGRSAVTNTPGRKSHPACFANATLDDGSGIEIVKDLELDEFFIRIQNMNWNLTEGVDDKEKLRLNLHRNGKLIEGGTMGWFILTKNTIAIPSLSAKQFSGALWNTTFIRVIMPGDNQNFSTFIASPHVVSSTHGPMYQGIRSNGKTAEP